jgi:hypothetical protein
MSYPVEHRTADAVVRACPLVHMHAATLFPPLVRRARVRVTDLDRKETG